MTRHTWTPRQLARHVTPLGFTGRPGLRLRLRADQLPPLRWSGLAWRWPNLAEVGWPVELVQQLRAIERGWKYVDLLAEPRHVLLVLRGYAGVSVRPLLGAVVDLIHTLQARGLRVEVA